MSTEQLFPLDCPFTAIGMVCVLPMGHPSDAAFGGHFLVRRDLVDEIAELRAKYRKRSNATPRSAEREELIFIRSHLAHHDQDANHAWLARRINAVLAGRDPTTVPGWQESDGVREHRAPSKERGVSVTRTDLGYRLAIPHAWAKYIGITEDEARTLAAALNSALSAPNAGGDT